MDYQERCAFLEKRIKRLNAIGLALSTENDTNKIFEMILDEARYITNADGRTLYMVDENGNLVGIQTVKGKVDETSEDAYHLVDGISGATMTSRGLNQFLLKDLKFYDPFFSKIRSKWSG